MIKALKGSDKYNSYNPIKKAEWWKDVIKRLENEIGTERSIKILNICGSKCCGQGHRKTVRNKFEESNSIEDFLDKISIEGVTYELVDKKLLLLNIRDVFVGRLKAQSRLFLI